MASKENDNMKLDDEQTEMLVMEVSHKTAKNPRYFEFPNPTIFYENIARKNPVLEKCKPEAMIKKMKFLRIKYSNSVKLREIQTLKSMIEDRKLKAKLKKVFPLLNQVGTIFEPLSKPKALIDMESVLVPFRPKLANQQEMNNLLQISSDISKRSIDLVSEMQFVHKTVSMYSS